MTENGDPSENPAAERLNGILKEEFFIGDMTNNLEENKRRIARTISIYNHRRPHLSCEVLTPGQMHQQHEKVVKTWLKKASNYQVA